MGSSMCDGQSVQVSDANDSEVKSGRDRSSGSSLRVLFVCSGNSRFGISPFIKSQAESLQRNGVEIEWFTVQGRGPMGYMRHLIKLGRHLRSRRYDVVHAHYGFCGWLAVLQRPKVPVVISFMGTDVYGRVDKFGKPRCLNSLYLLSTRLLIRLADQVIVKAPGMIPAGVQRKKINVIPNGVDFVRFRPMEMLECRRQIGISAEKRIVLFLGNPHDPRKNVALLESAVALLDRSDVEVIKPYPVTPDLIPIYMNAADVVVLSSYLEGSPNVVKEAMACSRPIVATAVGDVEWVISGVEGCHVVSFEPADMARKLAAALDFGKETNGRNHIRHLDDNVVAEKIVSLYRAAVDSSRAAP